MKIGQTPLEMLLEDSSRQWEQTLVENHNAIALDRKLDELLSKQADMNSRLSSMDRKLDDIELKLENITPVIIDIRSNQDG